MLFDILDVTLHTFTVLGTKNSFSASSHAQVFKYVLDFHVIEKKSLTFVLKTIWIQDVMFYI